MKVLKKTIVYGTLGIRAKKKTTKRKNKEGTFSFHLNFQALIPRVSSWMSTIWYPAKVCQSSGLRFRNLMTSDTQMSLHTKYAPGLV